MDYQFWIPVATLATTVVFGIMGGVGTYYQYKAFKMAEQRKGSKRVVPQVSWFWRYGQFFVLLIGVVAVWMPYILTNVPDQPQHNYLTHWGPEMIAGVPLGQALPIETLTTLQVGANARGLLTYKNKYRLGAMAYHVSGLIDVDDIGALQKSSLYDIQDDEKMQILIPVNQTFRDEMKNGFGSTNYALVLMPNGRSMNDFKTMRQAKALGIKFVGFGAGPP